MRAPAGTPDRSKNSHAQRVRANTAAAPLETGSPQQPTRGTDRPCVSRSPAPAPRRSAVARFASPVRRESPDQRFRVRDCAVCVAGAAANRPIPTVFSAHRTIDLSRAGQLSARWRWFRHDRTLHPVGSGQLPARPRNCADWAIRRRHSAANRPAGRTHHAIVRFASASVAIRPPGPTRRAIVRFASAVRGDSPTQAPTRRAIVRFASASWHATIGQSQPNRPVR